MASSKIVHVTSANWDAEVAKASVTVLVDFWAPWCGPCRAIAPVLDDLAEELDGKLKICKVNVDEEQQLPNQFAVRSIPALIVMKNGEVAERFVGAMPKNVMLAKLQPHL